MRLGLLLCPVLAIGLTGSADLRAETYRIAPDGRSVVVRTRHLEAKFEGPDLVNLVNLLTGETYTRRTDKLDGGLARVSVRNAGGLRPLEGGWQMEEGNYGAVFEGKLAGSNSGSYTLRLRGDSGQLIIECESEAGVGDVSGISWGINYLNIKSAEAVLPARGGRVLSADCDATSEELDYPSNWEAQFAVLAGKRGSACIFSTDARMQFKRLSYTRAGSAYQLVFQTDNPAPFEFQSSAKSVEWRIDCFDKGWRTAATAYVDQMRKSSSVLYHRPEVVHRQKWTRSIRAVVRVGGDYSDTSILDELARQVDPRKTLLYFYDWRKDGYDVNYPDYTGKPGLTQFTRHAQGLGFHVLFHVDLPGVTASNPAYEQVKAYQVKDPFSLQPLGWYWGRDLPQAFAFINPASAEFRRIFVEAMRGIVENYGADAVHLDVSAPMWNDANGPIDGMNYCQGSVKLHEELLAALPDLVLGGESINELLAPYEHFVQRWAWPCNLKPHPISEFIFGEMTASYGYLGQPNPDRAPSAFLDYVRVYEGQGVLPSLAIDSISELRGDRSGAQRFFAVMREWQKHDLRPDWGKKWGQSTLFSYTGSDGATAAVERTPTGVRLVCNGRVLYERVEGVAEVKTSGHIPGHAAYAPGRAFGLKPERSYWVEPGPPDLNSPHVSALKGSALLDGARIGSDLVAFRFDSSAGSVLLDLAKSISRARVGTILNGARYPLERGASYASGEFNVSGESVSGIGAHPPWKPAAGQNTNPGGCTSAVYSFGVPPASEGRCALEFGAGMNDVAQETDGVSFIVRIDGKESFRKHVEKGAPLRQASVDLSAYAGRTVDLELVTDPGPAANTNWDHAVWINPRIVVYRSAETCAAEVSLPKKPLGMAAGRGPGDSSAVLSLRAGVIGGETLSDGLRRPLPCSVYFYYEKPLDASLPLDLTTSHYTAGLVSGGDYSPGSAWGSGSIEQVEIDGAKHNAVNGHPPSRGQTVLTWLLNLPEKRCALKFVAGVKPKALTTGVGFAVKVNGDALWLRSTESPGWWSGEVNLSSYAGQVIVLELVTDSQGEENFDWATWASPRIVAAE